MDRHGAINYIQDRLGSKGSPELAERIYKRLRSDGGIYYSNDCPAGLKFAEGLDLIVIAAQLNRFSRERR